MKHSRDFFEYDSMLKILFIYLFLFSYSKHSKGSIKQARRLLHKKALVGFKERAQQPFDKDKFMQSLLNETIPEKVSI